MVNSSVLILLMCKRKFIYASYVYVNNEKPTHDAIALIEALLQNFNIYFNQMLKLNYGL